MHRKIVFVKVESSVIEISKSVHWSRRYYLYKRLKLKLYWDPKEQSTKRHPVYIRYPKKLVQYGRVRIEIKHLYPCFIAEINYKYSFWCVFSWFNSYAPELVTIFYYRDKIRIQMFYFFIQTVFTKLFRVHVFFLEKNPCVCSLFPSFFQLSNFFFL